jgi:hypothetical protein
LVRSILEDLPNSRFTELKRLRQEMVLLAGAERDGRWHPHWKQQLANAND